MAAYIGIDIGTSSLKAVRVKVSGDLASVEDERNFDYGDENNPTRQPVRWEESAENALSELWESGVQGVGFTGQMHGLVALDAQGDVLAPTLLWLDMDGDDDLRLFGRRYSVDFVTRTSNIALPDFTLAKWLYASRVVPELASRTSKLMPVKDYVRWRLFGHIENVTDPSEAVGMQMFNPFTDSWDWDIADSACIPRGALPVVRPAQTVVAASGKARGRWPIDDVVVGAGDQACAARATGANKEGVVSISLGTSGVVSVPWKIKGLPLNWDGTLHLLPGTSDDVMDVIATVPAFGPGLRWVAHLLGGDLSNLDRQAASVLSDTSAPDEARPLFFPFLNGSGAPHPNIHTRGALSGLSLTTGPADIARAAYDGFAMEMATLLNEVRAWGAPVREVVISGGASRLEHFTDSLVSFMDVPCYRVDESSASAVGAALLAWDAENPGGEALLPRLAVRPRYRRNVDKVWLRKRNKILAGQR